MSKRKTSIAKIIAEEMVSCGIKFVASLPDDWISELISTLDDDPRFKHVPVNREESAIGLCSGAYMGGTGSAALMGASGFMTVIYAITKINYTYEIPILLMVTLRGALGDHHKHHISNGLYLEPMLDTINLPYAIIQKPEDIPLIGKSYKHSVTYSRPTLVAMTHDLLRRLP